MWNARIASSCSVVPRRVGDCSHVSEAPRRNFVKVSRSATKLYQDLGNDALSSHPFLQSQVLVDWRTRGKSSSLHIKKKTTRCWIRILRGFSLQLENFELFGPLCWIDEFAVGRTSNRRWSLFFFSSVLSMSSLLTWLGFIF
jgi:hypothetical protein